MSLNEQPRIQLAFLPTPIHQLQRITKYINGPEILIKRDDQTGLAFGGNKTRKIEYLFGHALQQDVDTIITRGTIQSNSCRQSAAAAAQLGLRCELLLKGKRPDVLEGNALLDELLGAKLHYQEEISFNELTKNIRKAGYKPYIIPFGGSNAIGALGYVNAMIEFIEQQKYLNKPITHIVFASCSGATHVGLLIGAKLTQFSGEIIGISTDRNACQKTQYQKVLVDMANQTAIKLKMNMTFNEEDFSVNYDYATGYGVVGELEKNAITLLAKQEGILLDPVYSGRAFGALLDMIKKRRFTENDSILFWHTGGTPALFPYGNQLHSHSLTLDDVNLRNISSHL